MGSRPRVILIGLGAVLVIGLLAWYVVRSRSSADIAPLAEECTQGGPNPLTSAGPAAIAGPNSDGLVLALANGSSSQPRFARSVNNPIEIMLDNTSDTAVASRSAAAKARRENPNARVQLSEKDRVEYFEVHNYTGERVADSAVEPADQLEDVPVIEPLSNLAVVWDQQVRQAEGESSLAPLGTYTVTFPNTEGPLQFTLQLVPDIYPAVALDALPPGPGGETPRPVTTNNVTSLPGGGRVISYEGVEGLGGQENNKAQTDKTVICPDGIRLAYASSSSTEAPAPTEPPAPGPVIDVDPPRVIGPNSDGLELSLWQHADGVYLRGASDPIRMFLLNTNENSPIYADPGYVPEDGQYSSHDTLDHFEVFNSNNDKIFDSGGDAVVLLSERPFIAPNGYIQGIEWNQLIGVDTETPTVAPAGTYRIRFPNTAGPLEVEITLVESDEGNDVAPLVGGQP